MVHDDMTNFVIDTGANQFIVNNKQLLINLRSTKGGMKEVGGNTTDMTAMGDLHLQLSLDNETTTNVTF